MNINFELRQKLVKAIPEMLNCFQCGTCVSGCPADKYGKGYSPRRKILSALYGDEEIFKKELWKCVTCHQCNEHCPQDVNPYDVLIKLKNYAVKNKLVEGMDQAANHVMMTGCSLPITDRVNKKRQELGLEPKKEKTCLGDLFKDE